MPGVSALVRCALNVRKMTGSNRRICFVNLHTVIGGHSVAVMHFYLLAIVWILKREKFLQ